MKPFLSDKNKATEKITLVSDDKIFSDDLEIAEKFNEFFRNTATNLNLSSNEDLLLSTTHLSDPVQIAIEKNKNHPSILTIQSNVKIKVFLSKWLLLKPYISKSTSKIPQFEKEWHAWWNSSQMSKVSRQ